MKEEICAYCHKPITSSMVISRLDGTTYHARCYYGNPNIRKSDNQKKAEGIKKKKVSP